MCKCPVCGMKTENAGALSNHILRVKDAEHLEWWPLYCERNKISVAKDRQSFTKALERDFTHS